VEFLRRLNNFGRKPVLITATAVCSIGAGSIGLVPDGNWVIFSMLRVVVGFGLGGVGTLLVVILVEFTTEHMRLKLLGWPLITPSLGTALATTTTSALISALGWRGVACLGVVLLLLCTPFAFVMPESPRWLIAQRQTVRARRAMAKFCGVTETTIPPAMATERHKRKLPPKNLKQ
jgi:MFS transporter, putative metabolite:H+ symporter